VAEGRPDGQITAKVSELDIPIPFDLDEFIARLERQRGRTILLFPFTAGPEGPCGVWISTAETDYVYHERETTSLHKAHIVLHEIGHMILGHQCSTPAVDDLARILAPDVGPELIRLVLGRSGYTSEDEREAETFASLVLERASRPADPKPAAEPEVAVVLDRLERTWGRGSHDRPCLTSCTTSPPPWRSELPPIEGVISARTARRCFAPSAARWCPWAWRSRCWQAGRVRS